MADVSVADSDEALLRTRLSAYELGSCVDVERDIADPVVGLIAVIANTPDGGAPVAAARCLVTLHLGEAEGEVMRWLNTPGHKGLALVVLGALDTLPPAEAARLGDVALAGPYAGIARSRLSRSVSPALRALAIEVVQ
jgi:hypothetical protein